VGGKRLREMEKAMCLIRHIAFLGLANSTSVYKLFQKSILTFQSSAWI